MYKRKYYWDIKNVVSTAVKEIIENKKIEIADSLEIIVANTGLTLEKIKAIAQTIEL